MVVFFFFKQKTAYELRISDGSSDVCSSDLKSPWGPLKSRAWPPAFERCQFSFRQSLRAVGPAAPARCRALRQMRLEEVESAGPGQLRRRLPRSEEHTSELQSLMRISYAVFCLKKKKLLQHS